MSGSPYLERIAQLEDELTAVEDQRDDLKRELSHRCEENKALRKECQRLSEALELLRKGAA